MTIICTLQKITADRHILIGTLIWGKKKWIVISISISDTIIYSYIHIALYNIPTIPVVANNGVSGISELDNNYGDLN
jgi:hypothetical protein